jgi:Protein of unknown function, DUF488
MRGRSTECVTVPLHAIADRGCRNSSGLTAPQLLQPSSHLRDLRLKLSVGVLPQLDEGLVVRCGAIEALVDVRRFPGSRRLPQFGSALLEQSLSDKGIAYIWLPSLGGRRKALADSPNNGWRNESFRGYADHIASEEFADGLNELLGLAGGIRTAIMCAELLWWRCHRRLIADVLVSIGVEVNHIRDAKVTEAHKITPPGRVVDGVLTYTLSEASFELIAQEGQ